MRSWSRYKWGFVLLYSAHKLRNLNWRISVLTFLSVPELFFCIRSLGLIFPSCSHFYQPLPVDRRNCPGESKCCSAPTHWNLLRLRVRNWLQLHSTYVRVLKDTSGFGCVTSPRKQDYMSPGKCSISYCSCNINYVILLLLAYAAETMNYTHYYETLEKDTRNYVCGMNIHTLRNSTTK